MSIPIMKTRWIVAVVSIVGCKGSSSSSSGSGEPARSSGKSDLVAVRTAKLDHCLEACDLVTVDEVKELTGAKTVTPKPTACHHKINAEGSECTWRLPEDEIALEVSFDNPAEVENFTYDNSGNYYDRSDHYDAFQKLDGIGDRAFAVLRSGELLIRFDVSGARVDLSMTPIGQTDAPKTPPPAFYAAAKKLAASAAKRVK